MTTLAPFPNGSSSLEGCRYDTATQELYIGFKSGLIYRYRHVPRHLVGELFAASSHGQYFAKHIRDCFQYEKVEDSIVLQAPTLQEKRREPTAILESLFRRIPRLRCVF